MGKKKVRSGAQNRNKNQMKNMKENEDEGWEDDEILTSTINLTLDGQESQD